MDSRVAISHPLEEFPLFPTLLPELRVCIWQWALQIPRLVLVCKHEGRGNAQIRRSVASPLLAVNHEARNEALRYYANPFHPPFPVPCPACPEFSGPCYIGPGSDILYIVGTDSPTRRYKSVTWTCIFLAQDIDSPSPSFAPVRRLAVDEEFLRQTPFYQFGRMPHSVWKLMIEDLKMLEEVYVVKRQTGGWGKADVERRLGEAERGYKKYWEEIWDLDEKKEREKWRMPVVKVVSVEELVGLCWC